MEEEKDLSSPRLGTEPKNSIMKRAGFDQQVKWENNRLWRNLSFLFLDYPFLRKNESNLKQIFRSNDHRGGVFFFPRVR